MSQQINDNGKTVAHDNFNAIMNIMPEIIEGKYAMMRFEVNDDYMPLVIEPVMSNVYSLKHLDTYKGGTILDPEIELYINSDRRTVDAMSFTQYPAEKKVVAGGQAGQPLRAELNAFLSGWLKNIEEQGYKPKIALLPPDKDLNNLTVHFNTEGKPFHLGYIYDSSGSTAVLNTLEKDENHTMMLIAEIEPKNDEPITYHADNLPDAVKLIVEERTATILKGISTDANVNKTVLSEQADISVEPESYKLEYHDIPVYGVEVYNDNKEQIANVLHNGRIEYLTSNIPQSAHGEIEQFAKKTADEREAEFFNMDGNVYAIYTFEPIPGVSPAAKENYRLAWFGEKTEADTLDTIKADFSREEQYHYEFLRPESGRSLGSLDIIAIKEDGKLTAWLVQDLSFYRLRDFFSKDTQLHDIKAMPDKTITPAERDSYGYRYDDMLPLQDARAVELFDSIAIYKLYPDDTEAMIFDIDEIPKHDGVFGIEKTDWLASREYAEMVKDLEQGAASQEAAFILENDTASYVELLREHINNHFEYGYLTEAQAQVLYSNIDSLNIKMLAESNLYENGIPLDVETDTIDRLFRDELAQAPEQAEPTQGNQPIADTRAKNEKYSIMTDLKEKIGVIAQQSGKQINTGEKSSEPAAKKSSETGVIE